MATIVSYRFSGGPTLILGKKKEEVTEGRKADKESKTTPFLPPPHLPPLLAQGLDLPLRLTKLNTLMVFILVDTAAHNYTVY